MLFNAISPLKKIIGKKFAYYIQSIYLCTVKKLTIEYAERCNSVIPKRKRLNRFSKYINILLDYGTN